MGDDYVTKPFSLDELVARVRAVLRRSGADTGDGDEQLRFADLFMDVSTHEVWRQNHRLELTATEFNVLRYLIESAKRVVSKSDILDHVWDYSFDGTQHRRDLHQLPPQEGRRVRPAAHPHVRGVGYSLRVPR